MSNKLIYDLPTRIFHWLFAGLFVFAFTVAKTIDDDSPVFAYHMLAGLMLGYTVFWRILWGFIGSKHARFSHFALHPLSLFQYGKGILTGSKKRWAGHNPASSWAALAMMALALGMGITGYLMASGQKESWEDIHELLANAFLVVAILHVLGVALHTMRHRDWISLSMFTGKKAGVEPAEAIPNSRPWSALAFLGLLLAFAFYLNQNYDAASGNLNLFGSVLQLSESEGGGEEEGGEREEQDD